MEPMIRVAQVGAAIWNLYHLDKWQYYNIGC